MSEIVLDENINITGPYLFESITEAVKNSFPDSLHVKLSKTSTRKQMLEDFGEKAFLDPTNLKYPIINPFTKKVDCRLIQAAKVRASQYHKEDIINKAEKAYKDNNCKSTIKVKVAKESVDLEDIFNFFDLEESSKDIIQHKGDYQKIVQQMMKKYNIKKISDLKDPKIKKQFFDELDSSWTSKREKLGLDKD